MTSHHSLSTLTLTESRRSIRPSHLMGTTLVAALIASCGQGLSVAATILGSPTPLSSLQSDEVLGITAGDKYFTQFSYSRQGDMPVAMAINVYPIMDDAGNYGLRFQGDFRDLPGGGFATALIRYRVITTDSRFVQNGATLSGSITVGPDSYGGVDQSFLGFFNTLNIYSSTIGPTPVSELIDSTTFDAYKSSFSATSDIFAQSGLLAVLDQTYTRQMLGDYDGDEDVDGGDFLVWQREFGATTETANADGNGDHVVDAADLAVWRTQFGLAAPEVSTGGAFLAVPEPVAVVLAAPAIATMLHRRRKSMA